MSRRDHGPKRRAESYAYRAKADAQVKSIRQMLIAAYMAGYGSAARTRKRKNHIAKL